MKEWSYPSTPPLGPCFVCYRMKPSLYLNQLPPISVALEKTGCISYFLNHILYLCFLPTVSLGLCANGVSNFIGVWAADVS